jgi:hypothetical protein
MREAFAQLLRQEVAAVLDDPKLARLEVTEVRIDDWPDAVVVLRDPYRPRSRFAFRASAALPGGDADDPRFHPTAASLAAAQLAETVLPVLRAPASAADADGTIWF